MFNYFTFERIVVRVRYDKVIIVMKMYNLMKVLFMIYLKIIQINIKNTMARFYSDLSYESAVLVYKKLKFALKANRCFMPCIWLFSGLKVQCDYECLSSCSQLPFVSILLVKRFVVWMCKHNINMYLLVAWCTILTSEPSVVFKIVCIV